MSQKFKEKENKSINEEKIMTWKIDMEYLIHDLKKAKEKGAGQKEHGKIMKRSHLKITFF